ncbi:MAG: carboxypeptidase-like regulatory domain-containing protein [Flavobacteriaceae bacterium]
MKITLLILFICAQTFAQKIVFKGTLLDKESKNPIAYANISFIDVKKGISTLEDGSFELEIKKKYLNKKVHISCLNYNDTLVLAQDLNNKIIYLTPKAYELEEIVLKNSKKRNKELIIKKIKRKELKLSLAGVIERPWTVARYFEYKENYKETPYIKTVTVFSSRFEKRKAKFRIRIFSKDAITALPKDDLLKENMIVDIKTRGKNVQIDVSKYNIEIPENGFFIALERLHIPYNFHEFEMKFKGGTIKKVNGVAPDFGAIGTSNEKFYGYLSGKWYRRSSTFVPAIFVTLSN